MTKDDLNEPKARGGRRRRKPIAEASLQNLKPGWKRGESGNPAGKPKSSVEITKLARDYSPAAIERLHSIAHNPAAPFRDQVAAANALLDRGLGRPAMPVFHGSSGGMSSMDLGEGVPMSALVSAARRGDEGYENELRRELAHLESMKAREREAFEAQIKEAERVQAAGGEIDPMAALLLRVRGDRDDGEPAAKPAPRIEAPKTDFIVDSTGNAAPAPSVESASPRQNAPEPAAGAAGDKPKAAPPPPPKHGRRPTQFPGFDAYSAEKARTRSEDEARAAKVEEARAQGRSQISAAESFPPDP